jgi:hypothetical protein
VEILSFENLFPDASTPFAETLDFRLTENAGKKHVSTLPIWECSLANRIAANLHQRLLPGPGVKSTELISVCRQNRRQ